VLPVFPGRWNLTETAVGCLPLTIDWVGPIHAPLGKSKRRDRTISDHAGRG
jgi:hypothetical protein